MSVGNIVGAILELAKGKDRLLGRKTIATIGTLICFQWGFIGLYILHLSENDFERLNIKYIVSSIIFPIGFLIPILSVFIVDTFIYYFKKNKLMK